MALIYTYPATDTKKYQAEMHTWHAELVMSQLWFNNLSLTAGLRIKSALVIIVLFLLIIQLLGYKIMKNPILFIMLIFSIFLFSGYSHAQPEPDSEGFIVYTGPNRPYPNTESDRSECLAKSVLVEIECRTNFGGICGWVSVEGTCNWGTPDAYCCKTQEQIDSLYERAYARACQIAIYEDDCPSHNPSLYTCYEVPQFGFKIPAKCSYY